MARPLKRGLDYFPIDCNMDNQMELLEAETGLEGFAIIIKLWQWIYSDRGYYMEWGEDTQLLFSRRIGTELEIISGVIEVALKRNIFDGEKYNRYNILTSKGIQARYLSAIRKRKDVEMIREYIIDCNVDEESIVVVGLLAEETELMAEETKLPHTESTQSKGEYSKVKKSKEDKPVKHKYGEHKNVLLTDAELEKLKERFHDYKEKIDNLSWYIASKGNKYVDHYKTILNWARKEEKQSKPQSKSMGERLAEMKERGDI